MLVTLWLHVIMIIYGSAYMIETEIRWGFRNFFKVLYEVLCSFWNKQKNDSRFNLSIYVSKLQTFLVHISDIFVYSMQF
jgi:hypothetical protein